MRAISPTTRDMRYGPVAIFFHWTVAVLIGAAWLLPQLTELASHDAARAIIGLHRSLGMTVLALVLGRMLWRLVNPPPGLPAGTAPAMRWAAHAGHAALYLLMVAVPVFGMLLTWAAGRDLSFWGLFTLPAPITPSPDLRRLFSDLHAVAANLIMALAGLHAGAALLHQYVLKDGLLERMLPQRSRAPRGGPGALI